MPLYFNFKILIPSSPIPKHSAFNFPSPKLIIVPSLTLLAGFTKHSQVSLLISFNNNISITALVSSLTP